MLVCRDLYFYPPHAHPQMFKITAMCSGCDVYYHIWIIQTFTVNCIYMRDSACRWLIAENAKIFGSYVKHFLIFPREIYYKILIGLCK